MRPIRLGSFNQRSSSGNPSSGAAREGPASFGREAQRHFSLMHRMSGPRSGIAEQSFPGGRKSCMWTDGTRKIVNPPQSGVQGHPPSHRPETIRTANRINTALTSGGGRNSEFFVAVAENTARLVGVAAFSLFAGTVLLLETYDNCLYEETLAFLASVRPSVILLRDREISHLSKLLEDTFSSAKFEFVDASQFNELKGAEVYRRISGQPWEKATDRGNKYVVLAALNCLYGYFLQGEDFFVDVTKLRVEHYHLREHLLIPTATARALEIVISASQENNKGPSLFSLFDCATYGGGMLLFLTKERLLRANFLQPKTTPKFTHTRQAIVKALMAHQTVHEPLYSILKKFRKLDSLLVKLYAEPNDSETSIVYLCKVIEDIQSLGASTTQLMSLLGSVESEELANLTRTVHLQSLQAVNNLSREHFGNHAEVQDDEEDQNTEVFTGNRGRFMYFLKDKISLVVDLARLSLARVNENLSAAVLHYKTKLSPTLKLQRSKRQGYYLKLPSLASTVLSRLDEEIIFVEHTGKFLNVQTDTLKRLSITTGQAEQDILSETARLARTTLDLLREHVEVLFQVNRLVAQVDVLLQFCLFAGKRGTVCLPIILGPTPKPRILAKQAKDPLCQSESEDFCRYTGPRGTQGQSGNDYCLSEFTPLQIVLGEQGSGKTSYVLNLVRLCILAYNGCPVPAEAMQLSCINKLLIKLKAVDSPESLLSSMGNELQEIENCLQASKNPNDQSLVILDGFCSSSNHLDAQAHLKSLVEIFLLRNLVGYVTTGEKMHEDIVDCYMPLGKVVMETGPAKGRAALFADFKVSRAAQVEQFYSNDSTWTQILQSNASSDPISRVSPSNYSVNEYQGKGWQQELKKLLFGQLEQQTDPLLLQNLRQALRSSFGDFY